MVQPDTKKTLNEKFTILLDEVSSLKRPLILDGAVGTMLDDLGVDVGDKLWSGKAPLDSSEDLYRVHREYVEAGADVITTCTFRTTQRAFAIAHMPKGAWREATKAAVAQAKKAAGENAVIAGSISPLEDCFRYKLAPNAKTAYEEHYLLAEALAKAGVDILWLETFASGRELLAAARAAKDVGENAGIPFSASYVTNKDGEILSGDNTPLLIEQLCELGALSICVNCIPPWFVSPSLRVLERHTTVPFGIYANIGRAEAHQGWHGHAHMTPKDYWELSNSWFNRGAKILGSCCGSTPDHTRAISRGFKSRS